MDTVIYQKVAKPLIKTLSNKYLASLSGEYDAIVNEVSKSLTGGYVY